MHSQTQTLLGKLYNWCHVKSFLSGGFSALFCQMPDEQHKKNNLLSISKGNHESALNHLQMLHDNVIKEVNWGYQFVFDKSIINCMPDSAVAPYSVAYQSIIDDKRSIVIKHRPMHN